MNKKTTPTALIVDDEPDILELLGITLSGMNIDTHLAATLQEAKHLLATKHLDFCLTDMRLPDGNGMELVEEISRQSVQIPVAVITAFGSVETAVEAMRKGAFDFITKPIELDVLRGLVKTALKLSAMRENDVASEPGSQGELLGDTLVMQELRSKIARLALSQAPVYISGESGTGKELVARLIHALGARSDAPFVPVNCGAIPPDLLESELFGHKKGAFTGAISNKEGLFQAANGGTLFLDEIAELPLQMQVKLLRVIQEKAVRPVGGHKETAIDVRLLSATNSDLNALVQRGDFREDLYYRVNVIELSVPPLRERQADIPLLAEHIMQKLADKNGVPPAAFTPEALEELKDYVFPGNVRELENILERALTWADGGAIQAADLSLPEVNSVSSPSMPEQNQKTAETEAQPAEQNSANEKSGVSDLNAQLEAQQHELITRALEEPRWNRTAAAKKLGITFRALRHRLKTLGLE
jgi:two-component system response regulator PilR (NtrC family)